MAEVRELGSSVAQGLKVACEAGRDLGGTRVLRDAVGPTYLGTLVNEAERLVEVAGRAVDEILGLLEDLDPCGSLLGEVLGSVAEEVEGLVPAEGRSLKEVGSEDERLCSLATANGVVFFVPIHSEQETLVAIQGTRFHSSVSSSGTSPP